MTTMELDKLSREELMAFWARVNRHPVKTARELFPERQELYVSATKSLGAYASNLAAMLYCHEKGDKHEAGMYRFICDRIRDKLPLWAD